MSVLVIDDFRLSIAILREVLNSGQTFIKCRDLACNIGTTTFRKLKGFEYENESQISFPNFVFRCQVFYSSVVWNSKNFSTMLLGCKRIHKPRAQISWIFTDFHIVIRVQSPTCNQRTEISAMATLTLKSSILCRLIFRYAAWAECLNPPLFFQFR